MIEVTLNALAKNMTPYEAYCLGCFLKYRLRAGKKDGLTKDITKSEEYLSFINGDKKWL